MVKHLYLSLKEGVPNFKSDQLDFIIGLSILRNRNMEDLRMMYSFCPFEDVGGGCIPALEVNDNFLSCAIVTSVSYYPPIPTTWHTYHLQGRAGGGQGGKSIPLPKKFHRSAQSRQT